VPFSEGILPILAGNRETSLATTKGGRDGKKEREIITATKKSTFSQHD